MAIEAPYTTAQEINSQPGDATLGGVSYDPSSKAAFAQLGHTINQFNEANDNEIQQKRQQVFQLKQREQAYKNDVMAKARDYAHADAVMKYKQGIEDRDNLYKMLFTTDQSAHNLKGENGQDMSFPPLKGDDQYLNDLSTELIKGRAEDPAGAMNDPAYIEKIKQFQKAKNISSVRAIQVAKLRQQLSQTGDPQEQKEIQQTIDSIQNTPLSEMQLPDAHLPKPEVKSLLPDIAKVYPQGKGMETFEINGEKYRGVPTADFESILYSQDRNMLNQAYLNARTLPRLPEGSDPQAFANWNNRIQQLWKQRGGEEPLSLGQITPDGKVILNPDPRPLAVAMELDSKGNLTPDSESDKEAAEIEYKKAQTQKLKQETAKAQKELETGKSAKPTAEEMKENRDKEIVRTAVKEVRDVFTPPAKAKLTVKFPGWWKRNGIDPDEYTIYKELPSSTGKRYIGIEAEPTTQVEEGEGGKTTTKTIAGESTRPDKVFLAENKNTKKKELLFIKNQEIIARVLEKDAIINSIKHDAKYKPEQYDNKTAWVDEIYGEKDKPVAEVVVPKNGRPSNIPEGAVLVKGFWVDKKNRKVYNSAGEEIQPE